MGDHKSNPHAFGTKVAPRGVKDRLGRDLQPGDLVLLNMPVQTQLTWGVAGITPDLNPASPPNMGVVVLTATFRLQVPLTGQGINEITRVATAAEVAPQQPAALIEMPTASPELDDSAKPTLVE